jgi:L-seryl-tRNA(Ser) seleniumtransferase
MSETLNALLRAVPSIDELLRASELDRALAECGHELVTSVLRETVEAARARLRHDGEAAREACSAAALVQQTLHRLAKLLAPSLKRVFNLTGTVLHTNLGRAPLPVEAIEAMTAVAAGASNLEYDLATGRRGDRDVHVEEWICRLTGAEAATVVNNNAAAVLLSLNTLAKSKEVVVSRGELVEIGGAFRIPDVMARAGAKLVEVGTTNRTHRADFSTAIGPRTAALMKVHTSNYMVAGFTAAVPEAELAALAHEAELPFVVDLGSGTLIDLAQFGLPREPTVAGTIAAGADLVTFSGDKLLGGPQAGIVAGRRDLVARLKRNPLKRALRVDKMTLAALAAVLHLYADPLRAVQRVPTLRLLTRNPADIEAQARRVAPSFAAALGERAVVDVKACHSQIGSGALPVDLLPSWALCVALPASRGRALENLARAMRALPVPVIGRIADDALLFDLRTLDDEAGFIAQLPRLNWQGRP